MSDDAVREALAELVRLKDGPRDEEYERRKPLAWQAARDALATIPEWEVDEHGRRVPAGEPSEGT